MRSIGSSLVLVGVVVCAGCSGDDAALDLDDTVDLLEPADLGASDLRRPADLRRASDLRHAADLARTAIDLETVKADLATATDLREVDLARTQAPDLRMAATDLAHADLVAAPVDLRREDLATVDLAPPVVDLFGAGCNNQCAAEGDVDCFNGSTRRCVVDGRGCRLWGTVGSCPSGFCADALTCGVCTNTCPAAGATQCVAGADSTCVADAHGCLAWGPPATCANGCRDTFICEPCHHECPAFGATCSATIAGELDTCVVDTMGCRKLWAQTCALGCAGGACVTCTTFADPKLDAVLDNESGWYQDIGLVGTTAVASWNERNGIYAGTGWGLASVDASVPSALPAPAVTTLFNNDYLTRMRVAGTRIYYLDREGLQVDDATTPASPTPLGSFALADGTAIKRDLAVDGTTALVAADDGLHVVDVTDPAHPAQAALVTLSQAPRMVRCHAGTCAVASANYIAIVDVTTPAQPVVRVTLPVYALESYGVGGLEFDGTTVVVASLVYDQGQLTELATYTYQPPGLLSPTGTFPAYGGASDLFLDGTDLWASDPAGLGVIDLSAPASPRWRKRWLVSDAPRGLLFDGATLFTAGDGVTAYDPSRVPDLLQLPASTSDYLTGSDAVGALVALARSSSGLVLEDLRDPTHPSVISTAPMDAEGVAIQGSLAYVISRTTSTTALQIYDITSPWKPVLVGQVAGPGSYQYAEISHLTLSRNGDRAYALCDAGYLCVFDTHDPANPTLVAESDIISLTLTSQSAFSPMAMNEDTLYLPESNALHVIDMSTPNAPVELGQVALPGYDGDGDVAVAVLGTSAVTAVWCESAANTHCLSVVDAANPAAPVIVGSLQRPVSSSAVEGFDTVSIEGLRWIGDRVFLANEGGNIFVMDVSDPTTPKKVNDYWTAMPARALFESDRFLTAFTVNDFYSGGTPAAADQVIQLCP